VNLLPVKGGLAGGQA